MTLIDLYDWYLDTSGNLNRWMRGGSITPPTITTPGAPTNVHATLSGTAATITWTPPTSNGGSAITGYTVTLEGGATHTLGASATSDTFTGLGSGPYSFDVVAQNIVGSGPTAVARTSATTYRFPGDTLPLATGKILAGATETDEDGSKVHAGWEYVAPEADTGIKYSIQKHFCQGGSVETCFVPSTGEISTVAKAQRAKGHVVMFNVAIQQSSSSHFSTWREAANLSDSVVYNTYYNFIQWCEEGADAPDCPIWMCMPHEPQGPGPGSTGHKVDPVVSSGMTPGDYGDMNWAFRTVMDAYATAKAGSRTAYKWKRLSFGGIHTGDAFTATDYRAINGFYTSHVNGGAAIDLRVHDWIGGDPYQTPISGSTAVGRTGTPGWSNNMQAMATWCKTRGKPIVFGEYGVHNTDGDAGIQLDAWWSKVISGQWDIVAVIYFHSAPNGPPLNPAGSGNGRWLFTDLMANDPTLGSNGGGSHPGMYSTWKKIMRSTNVVHFWDVGSPGIPGGYSKPPGV